MNKVTMQDIADALGISRVTVWKVFNNYANVSAALRESVLAKAKEMGYTKGVSELESPESERNVSVIVSRPNSAVFWTNIIHRLAQELYLHNINLMYTYMPSRYSENYKMPPILHSNTVQGAIVLNVYDIKLMEQINQLKIPKVFLDIVPQFDRSKLSGDLLLLEGFHCIYQITESILDRGVRDIGFIGDIQYAKTNLDRYKGFCQCMKDHGIAVKEEICMTSKIGIFSYDKEIYRFLDSLEKLPEAFVCASDYVASFVQQYMDEHAQELDHPVTLTGFDNTDEYANVRGRIITANVPTGLLGKRLALQLLFRINHPDAPHELTFIKPYIINGASSAL